jgi:hypothetical protein
MLFAFGVIEIHVSTPNCETVLPVVSTIFWQSMSEYTKQLVPKNPSPPTLTEVKLSKRKQLPEQSGLNLPNGLALQSLGYAFAIGEAGDAAAVFCKA